MSRPNKKIQELEERIKRLESATMVKLPFEGRYTLFSSQTLSVREVVEALAKHLRLAVSHATPQRVVFQKKVGTIRRWLDVLVKSW